MAEQLTTKGFVFTGNDGRIYLCRMRGNQPWFFYWHPDKQWVSFRPTNQTEISAAYKMRLSDEDSAPYQLKNY